MSRRVTSKSRRNTRTKSRSQNNWRQPSQWPEWLRRSLSVITGCVVLGGFGYWSVASGHLTRLTDALGFGLVQMSGRAGFRIDDILVVGRKETSRDTILAVLNVQRGDPIFGFSPIGARQTLEQLSWVEKVRIERHLPDKINIDITERTPVALWQRDKNFTLIDRFGKILEADNLKKFSDLPVIIGNQAPAEVSKLLEMLGFEPVIAERVAAATWVGERRWDLTLDNKIKIKLPETNTSKALHHLSKLQSEHQILDRDIVAIDLRQPEQMVIEANNPADAQALNLQAGI
jgi:cell division protein FtsQ